MEGSPFYRCVDVFQASRNKWWHMHELLNESTVTNSPLCRCPGMAMELGCGVLCVSSIPVSWVTMSKAPYHSICSSCERGQETSMQGLCHSILNYRVLSEVSPAK